LHQSLVAAIDPAAASAIPFAVVTRDNWEEVAARIGAPATAFARAQGFDGKAGTSVVLPSPEGGVAAVLAGHPEGGDPFSPAKGVTSLPAGLYRLEPGSADPSATLLGLLLGLYAFTRYKGKSEARDIRFVVPDGVDGGEVGRQADAVAFARDLVNTPANDLGPAELEAAARAWAARMRASFNSIVGDDLLAQNFPLIHAVGRASSRPPRLIDITWGETFRPKVTLVGKGVCFDTGGLNIKPDAGMLLMKKDMAGAATALAAAQMIIEAKLPVRLRVLIPAVENAISGSAFRPGDVIPSRKGLSVEIGNTDAEGRLVLADALALADEEEPDLLLDFATLTGAARVALGPDLPPAYTDDEDLAAALVATGQSVNDPVWRMPLWKRYESMLDSKVADINHISGGSYAGSVTAALFLRRFVERAKSWAHFDIFGWTPVARPGRPEGGEPQTARLVLSLVRQRYGASA
jgi:leucyl aminopeptidase